MDRVVLQSTKPGRHFSGYLVDLTVFQRWVVFAEQTYTDRDTMGQVAVDQE
jgi:hypothetical protein